MDASRSEKGTHLSSRLVAKACTSVQYQHVFTSMFFLTLVAFLLDYITVYRGSHYLVQPLYLHESNTPFSVSSAPRVSPQKAFLFVYKAFWVTGNLWQYLHLDDEQSLHDLVKNGKNSEKELNPIWKHQFAAPAAASSFCPSSDSCAVFLKNRSARSSSKQNSAAPFSSSSLQYMLCSCCFPDSASFCCCWWSCSLLRGVSSLPGLRADKTVLTAGLILHGVLREGQNNALTFGLGRH